MGQTCGKFKKWYTNNCCCCYCCFKDRNYGCCIQCASSKKSSSDYTVNTLTNENCVYHSSIVAPPKLTTISTNDHIGEYL